MRTLLPFLLLLASMPGTADVRVVSHRLPSGATVILAPNVSSETLAVHLTLDAGSRLDPRGREGTAWIASRVIASRLGDVNASLNQERSVFTASVPLESLRDLFGRIGDVLRSNPVSVAELDRARGEVTDGGDSARVEELLLRLVYADRPHGHRPQSIPSRVREKDVDRFIREHYAPASAVVAIAGSFDEQRVLAAIEETLSDLPKGKARRRCTPYAVQLRRERSRVMHSTTARQTQIDIGYPTAAAPTPDWYALNILADILGQGPGSRLQRRLVAGGLATEYLEGETESPCTSSLLKMRARVASGVEPAAVMNAISGEMDRLARELVTDAELETAKEQERQWYAQQAATAADVASALARASLFYGDAARAMTDVSLMLAVTADDVRRVAQRYLRSSNRGIVFVQP